MRSDWITRPGSVENSWRTFTWSLNEITAVILALTAPELVLVCTESTSRSDKNVAASGPILARLTWKPAGEIGANELLYANTAGQAQPQSAVLALQVDVDVEEGAAELLASDPFGNQLKRGCIGRKFESVAILQFADAFLAVSQRRAKFVEVTLAGLGRERGAVAGKGRISEQRGRHRRKGHQKKQFHGLPPR